MKLGEGTTPRQWKDANDLLIANDEGTYIADADLKGGPISFEEKRANARLIAKAPLLIECRDVLSDLSHWFDVQLKRGTINAGTANRDSDFVTQIRALLAKLDK